MTLLRKWMVDGGYCFCNTANVKTTKEGENRPQCNQTRKLVADFIKIQ